MQYILVKHVRTKRKNFSDCENDNLMISEVYDEKNWPTTLTKKNGSFKQKTGGLYS